MEEIVDIVDKDNVVVGQVAKREAHEKGLLHRTVISGVIGSDKKWTLVKQASDEQDPGQFVSPIGGHVRASETEEDALHREAFEEYGLSGKLNYKLVGRAIFNREVRGKKENHYFIMFEIYTDTPPKLNEEAVSTRRFTKNELKEMVEENPGMFGDAFHFVWKTFYRLPTPIEVLSSSVFYEKISKSRKERKGYSLEETKKLLDL